MYETQIYFSCHEKQKVHNVFFSICAYTCITNLTIFVKTLGCMTIKL